jgi:hypothetical protein
MYQKLHFQILRFFASFLLVSLICFSPPIFAFDNAKLFDRADKREGSRWTLSEWLAQKERNKLMDLWLAMNTPSPYEFMLGFSYNNYQSTENQTTLEYLTTGAVIQAYAQIFGLSLEYENRGGEQENDLTGSFNLRLLGNSIQSTHLSVHFGQRTRTVSDITPRTLLRNQFGQMSLQIYLNPFFGINGLYRNYLPTYDATFGDVTGQYTTGGLFIDFKAIRILGEWYEDIQKNNGSSVSPEIKRNGIKTGLQFFF